MELECDEITRFVLPAIRISVAEGMSKEYKMSQQEIAARLGVAQVAVSKYLNGRYSGSVKKVRDYIRNKGLADSIIKSASGKRDSDAINSMIDRLCTKIVDNYSMI